MLLPLKEQICPRRPQIDNLRTPIPILLQPRTLEAVERVTDALPAAHDALVLVVAKGALVADAHKGRGPHVRVADGALAVAFVAETADCDAGLLAAHYEVGVVAGHGDGGRSVALREISGGRGEELENSLGCQVCAVCSACFGESQTQERYCRGQIDVLFLRIEDDEVLWVNRRREKFRSRGMLLRLVMSTVKLPTNHMLQSPDSCVRRASSCFLNNINLHSIFNGNCQIAIKGTRLLPRHRSLF